MRALVILAALTIAASATAQTTQTYSYDVHGRLLSATAGTGDRGGGAFTSYAFDLADSRVAKYAEPFSALASADRLQNGERLVPGQALVSADARFFFVVQTDGNAVIYGPTGGLWATNTYGTQAVVLAQQGDGNLQLWNATSPVWQSVTSGHPGAYLIMQSDGNLVIYDGGTAIWASGTDGH